MIACGVAGCVNKVVALGCKSFVCVVVATVVAATVAVANGYTQLLNY